MGLVVPRRHVLGVTKSPTDGFIYFLSTIEFIFTKLFYTLKFPFLYLTCYNIGKTFRPARLERLTFSKGG